MTEIILKNLKIFTNSKSMKSDKCVTRKYCPLLTFNK